MRIIPSLFLFTAGVALGSAVPIISDALKNALTIVGATDKVALSAPEVTSNPRGEDKEAERKDLVKLTPEQTSAQEIEVAPVGAGVLSRHVIVPGTIIPDVDRVSRVPARVVGTVAEMRKRLGDSVKQGEVVAVLDSREVADAKSEYLNASVNFDLQRTNFERTQILWDKRVSTEQQYLQVRATFSEAKLRFELARQKLSALGLDSTDVANAAKRDETRSERSSLRQYEIRAPMAGRVVERKVDVGTAVGSQGDPSDLYTVTDLSTVWVDLTVTPSDLGKLKEGGKVGLTSSGAEDKRAEARIIFVSPILNQETRAARVIASLDNRDLSWRPGTFVTAEIEIARDKADVIVPRNALQTIGGERVVFVRTPKGFQRRDVNTGRADDDAFEITSGLSVGEEIAVKNTFLLKAELGRSEAKHDD
jgi:cobalt-zinc-cadmium efflux system membrane fusion protein